MKRAWKKAWKDIDQTVALRAGALLAVTIGNIVGPSMAARAQAVDPNANAAQTAVAADTNTALGEVRSSVHRGLIYRNPRVYNIEYSFEMFPDPNKIDRTKDLKLWIPIPREWDSQKAVKIISVEHAQRSCKALIQSAREIPL